jgi:hypothetical protein
MSAAGPRRDPLQKQARDPAPPKAVGHGDRYLRRPGSGSRA